MSSGTIKSVGSGHNLRDESVWVGEIWDIQTICRWSHCGCIFGWPFGRLTFQTGAYFVNLTRKLYYFFILGLAGQLVQWSLTVHLDQISVVSRVGCIPGSCRHLCPQATKACQAGATSCLLRINQVQQDSSLRQGPFSAALACERVGIPLMSVELDRYPQQTVQRAVKRSQKQRVWQKPACETRRVKNAWCLVSYGMSRWSRSLKL